MHEYPERYFEDFSVGDRFVTGEATLSRSDCLDFARRYDPQPFHLTDEAAEASLFGKLSASGWMTAAVAMRLAIESGFLRGPGMVGAGIDHLRWLAPVYPGDTLHAEGEILELAPSAAGKRHGRLRLRMRTLNQHGTCVMEHTATLSVSMRPSG
jgi:acyl dehydratase